MQPTYLIHSAKGTEWADHKYYKKTPDGKYYYDEESYQRAKKDEQDLVDEEARLWEASKRAGNGSITQQQHRIAMSKLQQAVKTSEKIEKDLAAQKEAKNEETAKSSSKKGSGSSSKKDPNDPNSKFGKWGKGSTKTSDKDKKSSTDKATKETTPKETAKKETTPKETVAKETKTTSPADTKTVVKKSLMSANISLGDKDSFVATKSDNGGYTINVTYEDGSTQIISVNANGDLTSVGEKIKPVKHGAIYWNQDDGCHIQHSDIKEDNLMSSFIIRRK